MSPEWALAIVGIITCFVIGWQSWETRRSAKAARDSIVLTFRPKLIIRGIALIPGNYIPVTGGPQTEDGAKPFRIECVIANVGGTTAHITESNLTIFVPADERDGLPTFPPYSDARDSLGRSFATKPGEHQERLVALGQRDASRFTMLRVLTNGGATGPGNIFCFGFIQYRDKIGTSRRSAFCRHYDAQTGRFDRVENSDYEYAD
jgi:hypothetical protein